jgi:LysM repeat protein
MTSRKDAEERHEKMNTPSPLIPQGTLPSTRGKSHIRIAVITILAVHVVLLLALLMAGCKKTSDQARTDAGADPTIQPQPFDPSVLPAGGATASTPPPPTNVTPTPVVPPPVTMLQTTTPSTTTVTPPPTTVLGEGTEHIVMKGDYFSTIAKRYNVSVKAITAANPGVDSTKLKIGQKIRIPAVSATAAAPAGSVPESAASGLDKVYTVKSGDNLTKIAKVNDVSVKALRTANNLKTDQVKVGQRLKIPAKSATHPTEAAAAGGTGTNL